MIDGVNALFQQQQQQHLAAKPARDTNHANCYHSNAVWLGGVAAPHSMTNQRSERMQGSSSHDLMTSRRVVCLRASLQTFQDTAIDCNS
jgi:hypothetical protein